ncbi:MAG TPA: hypothetical protein VEH06_06380 [Candidatus Bathyarchaeia archaeon]|jgi:hypothetical protein|nr:hypothetical protein [Candidatus Bathyarchaeia archaeon]
MKILHNNFLSVTIFAGAAISGLLSIGVNQNIYQSKNRSTLLQDLGSELYDSVNSMKSNARNSSLVIDDVRWNVV